LAWLVHGM